MKLFITKILVLFLLYCSISLAISCITPYHWGNPWFSTKIQFLEKNQTTDYNTFFFGSSTIYRQIDPQVFDNTINSFTNENISSFNLGAPATFAPQSYYLYEKFLETDLSKDAKYCFMDLTDVDLLSDFFMHEERTTYWQNYSDIAFVTKSIYSNKKYNLKAKIESSLNYSTSYIENLLHLGHFGSQLINYDYYDDRYLGKQRDGFFPLEQDYETTKDPAVKSHLFDRKQDIIEHPELIENRKREVKKTYNNVSDNYDTVNLNRVLTLIKKSNDKGVKLIFILSPRNKSQQLINLSEQLPESNFIDLCDPQKNIFLYENQYSFDLGHFNTQGTVLYSELLAKEVKKRLLNVECNHPTMKFWYGFDGNDDDKN